MERKLCPYTAKNLVDLDEVNDEHVLPVAVGAPKKFYVRASAKENSRLNDLIDSPFSNGGLVRFMAMTQGVESRSGPVVAKPNAVLMSTGLQLTTTFSPEILDVRFKDPIIKNEKGQIIGVRGYGDEAFKHADRVKKDFAKKGKIVEFGPVRSEENPEIRVTLDSKEEDIVSELMKISYLMNVWTFGDKAITGPGGEIYRSALKRAGSSHFRDGGLAWGRLDKVFDSKLGPNQHQLLTVCMGDSIVSSVNLFGIFAGIFSTPCDSRQYQEGEGAAVTINATNASMTQTNAIAVLTANASRDWRDLASLQ